MQSRMELKKEQKKMAKKTVASLQKKGSKNFTKVIKMTKSSKSGSYSIKQEIVLKDKVEDFLKK